MVPLGAFAYEVVAHELGVRPRPKFAHALEVGLDGPGARWILCSYHVSQQNTFTGRLTPAMLDAVFARARELSR